MPIKKKKRAIIPELEVDLIPVLSCMFLLVPALLLAMEAANWASVPVGPPRHVVEGPADHHRQEPHALHVEVRDDGFVLSVGCTGCAEDEVVARAGQDGYDGLRTAALEIKASYPTLDLVLLSAQGETRLQTLVETMDALRGERCSVSPDATREGCLFTGVVIDA